MRVAVAGAPASLRVVVAAAEVAAGIIVVVEVIAVDISELAAVGIAVGGSHFRLQLVMSSPSLRRRVDRRIVKALC